MHSKPWKWAARLLFHNADIVMIKKALEQMQMQFAELGFTFENRLVQPSSPVQGK